MKAQTLIADAGGAVETFVAGMMDYQSSLLKELTPLAVERNDILNQIRKLCANNFFTELKGVEKETFQSDLLRRILDPHTPQTGTPFFLQTLCALLQKIRPELTPVFNGFQFSAAACAVCEQGHIDVLVREGDKALIIENKINNAEDQSNQLARYLEYTKTLGLETLAIVYLPRQPGKVPPLDTYDEQYRPLLDEIRAKLVILPVAGSQGADLLTGFLLPCEKARKLTETQQVIIAQYAALLTKLIGDKEMTDESTKEIDKKMLARIYADEANIMAAGNIASVWSDGYRRRLLLNSLLYEPLLAKLKENGYILYPEDTYDEDLWYKPVNDRIDVMFWCGKGQGELFIGLTPHEGYCTKKFGDSELEPVVNIVDGILAEPCFTKNQHDNGCVCSLFHAELYNKPVAATVDYLVRRAEVLEAAVKRLEK